MASNKGDSVQLSLTRAAPNQRLSLFLVAHYLVVLWTQVFFVLPARLFVEFVVCRWFSPIVKHVGRPLLAHFFVKLVQFNVTRGVPAQIRILLNSTRSYALAHAKPAFLKAGRGWANKVKVNGTHGWWIGNPSSDKSEDDVVVYFIHGGAFLFDSGSNCHEFFLSVIQKIKADYGLDASVFSLDYRLPPEYAYPTQLIEALAGYHYLVNTLGIKEDKIVIAGDSAGGNLAEALLLHLARPSSDVAVPEELGATPKRPGGALLISPYHNLYSKSHSLIANGTFDLLDSSLAARAAFAYIGAADKLPASYQFKMPSFNPLFHLFSPQRQLPHPAEHLPGVFGFSDIKGIERFKSPYVNPATCRDKTWWKEAMPGGGRTMVNWGGVEILADDCADLYNQLEKAGVEPAKLYKELGIHDWLLHDWVLPFSWRTKTKGPEGDFYYGRDRVVDLLHLVASTAKSPASAHVPSRAKNTARAEPDNEESATPAHVDKADQPKVDKPKASTPARAEKTDEPETARTPHAIAPPVPSVPGDSSYAHVAADDAHISPSAPVVAEGEQAVIVPLEVQQEQAQREKEAYEQAPTTRGPSFARVAADSEHIDPAAPVVAEGEGAVIDRSKAIHEVQPAQTDTSSLSASAPTFVPTQPAAKVQEEPVSTLPTVSAAKPKKKKKSVLSKAATTTKNGGTYADVAAHDDHVAADAPVVAEGEGATIEKASYLWLRDHCRNERSYHPATRQRLIDTPKIPDGYRPQTVRSDESGVYVTWPDSAFESSYESFFPWSFLAENAYNPPLVREKDLPSVNSRKVFWTSEIAKDIPSVTYEEVMSSEEGVYQWLKRIDMFGFSLCSGIPGTPEATEALIRRIAFIRETHYGGFWDFTANLEHGDLAYSDVRLEGHTDTTYFTDPCGLQLFHLLSPSSSHTGGHNLLIDGFRAASILKAQYPSFYALLSTLPIPSHASGSGSASLPSGVHLRPLRRFPVFNHDERGELIMVRWNGDDRGVVGGEAFEGAKMDEWYEALRVWEGILRSDEAQLWSKMEVGTAVIFDNLRVLHGRSAFTGSRRLCGAYVNGDDYRSRLRGLEQQFGGGDPRRRALEKVLRERYGIERSGQGKGTAWEEYM
ncbi:hypothetical protein JCM3770_006155 [Rhodotorula araucariae]